MPDRPKCCRLTQLWLWTLPDLKVVIGRRLLQAACRGIGGVGAAETEQVTWLALMGESELAFASTTSDRCTDLEFALATGTKSVPQPPRFSETNADINRVRSESYALRTLKFSVRDGVMS